MPGPMERKPIEWRQLCAIARDLLTAEPTIDDGEWAERIKQRLAVLGFASVRPPHRLTEAMRAVQRALEKRWGPRPIPDLSHHPARRVSAPPDPPLPRRSTAPQPWTPLAALVQRSTRAPGATASSEAPVIAKPLTLRRAEHLKALKLITQAIAEQMDRCDAAERAAEDAARVEEESCR